MPTVPTYDSFQAAPGALPQTRLTMPDAPDVAGQQAQQMGQGLQRAGGELGRIALDMAQQANQVRINDAMNKAVAAKNRLIYDPSEGFVHLRGEAALTRPDDKSLDLEYTEKLKKHFDEIETGLGNQAQRDAFRQQSGQLMSQFNGALTQHVAKEYGAFRYSVQEGTIQVARDQMALAWGDAELLGQSRDAIKAAVVEQGRLKGLSAQQVEANLVEALSPGHAAVIASATDAGKLDYAREYMKQVNAELTPGARLQIQKTLDAGDFEARTQDQADTLYSRHKGNISAALADARTNLSGKEEDAVVTRLKNYDAERVALRERGQKDAADQAWRIYAQSGGMGKIPPSVLASMDGRDLEALRRTARAESEAREVKTDPNVYYALTMAATQDANFKNEDLRRYFDRLSPTDRKHFIDLQAKTARPEDIDQVASAQQQVNAVIKSLRFKDEQAGVFTMQANKALFAAQQEKGRALNQEERQKVLDRLVLQGETPGVLWNSTSRAFEADAAGKPFVPKFSDADVRKATAALQRAGITKPTEAQIAATLKAVYGVK